MPKSKSPDIEAKVDGAPSDPGDASFDMHRRSPSQTEILGLDELLVPSSITNVRKPIAAIHAIPLKPGGQTLNSMRLFDALITMAQIDARKLSRDEIEAIRVDRRSPLITARIADLAQLAGIPGKNYNRIYEELQDLYSMDFAWNAVGEDNEVEFEMKAHFLASFGVGKGAKRGLVRFAFPPEVLAFILEPKYWATLSLQVMQGLKTATSYALWQKAWRYINTNAKMTAELPTATWIELIVGPSRYVVNEPNGTKTVLNYGDFKRRVLVDAIERINSVQALSHTLRLKESRSGNKVTRLRFIFEPKTVHRLDLPLTWSKDMIDVLKSIGFSDPEISTMSESTSREEVSDALVRLKDSTAKARAQGRPITSFKSYFNGILANVTAGSALGDIDHDQIEAQARQQDAERQAEERQKRQQEAFAQHQAKVFNETLFELPDAQRDALFNEFSETVEGKRAERLLKNGWTVRSAGALALLRSWMLATKPEQHRSLLPNPEDRAFDAWLLWRLDQAS